jgi:hypothetical protein
VGAFCRRVTCELKFPLLIFLVCLFLFFCGTKDGTQGFLHARQVLYHWTTPPVLNFLSLFPSDLLKWTHITHFKQFNAIQYISSVIQPPTSSNPKTFPAFQNKVPHPQTLPCHLTWAAIKLSLLTYLSWMCYMNLII